MGSTFSQHSNCFGKKDCGPCSLKYKDIHEAPNATTPKKIVRTIDGMHGAKGADKSKLVEFHSLGEDLARPRKTEEIDRSGNGFVRGGKL